MIFSKIWMVILASLAAVAIALVLAIPRPGERKQQEARKDRVRLGCSSVKVWLEGNAQQRMINAGKVSNEPKIIEVLNSIKTSDPVPAASHQTARGVLNELNKGKIVDVMIVVDNAGRVVARSGLNDDDWGDSIKGFYAVNDALHGYWADDIWELDGKAFLVAAAPVVHRGNYRYIGAVILGTQVTQEFSKNLADPLGVEMALFDKPKADQTMLLVQSGAMNAFETALGEAAMTASKAEHRPADDCTKNNILALSDPSGKRFGLVARLPGEFGERGGFMAFTIPSIELQGIMGGIGAVKQDDLSSSVFIVAGIVLVVGLAVGFLLQSIEVEKPLKALSKDAIRLAQDDNPDAQLKEELHRGTFGSIARSVNLYIEKLLKTRQASAQSLDQLLGVHPMPSIPAVGGQASPAAPAPAPSDFQFSGEDEPTRGAYDLGIPDSQNEQNAKLFDTEETAARKKADQVPSGQAPVKTANPNVVRKPTAPPAKPPSIPVPSAARQQSQAPARAPTGRPHSIGDNILGTPVGQPPDATQNAEYKRVFDLFVSLQKQLGETASPSFDKFALKLQRNEVTLKQKHNCDKIKFTVYEKDGRAALKASPVKL